MRKVKTQPIGSDEGTRLLDMTSQNVAQPLVKQMGCSVVAPYVHASLGINLSRSQVAILRPASDHTPYVDREPGQRLPHIGHLDFPIQST
jgi:hypothetical protein